MTSVVELLNENVVNNYIKYKLNQKQNNSYDPNNNNTRYLVLLACHCDSDIKRNKIKGNLKYFNFDCVDVLLVMSADLPYNLEIHDYCTTFKNIKYTEVPNEPTIDFGKWIYGLENIDYTQYDFTIFTNDSFIIHAPINHFFNLTFKYNVDFYGYNDSTQMRYHYQSYLFSLKKDAICTFINNYNIKKKIIRHQQDVIDHFELTMTDWFENHKCYLDIGNINSHKTKNIFFMNDDLYLKLKQTNLLPFTKIKRIY